MSPEGAAGPLAKRMEPRNEATDEASVEEEIVLLLVPGKHELGAQGAQRSVRGRPD